MPLCSWSCKPSDSFRAHAAQFESLVIDNERFACFLEICFCFASRFTLQKHRETIYKIWRALCKLAGMPMLPSGDDDHSTVAFEDNHYARLKAAAKKDEKMDQRDIYCVVNSYSTKYTHLSLSPLLGGGVTLTPARLSIYATALTANAMFYYVLRDRECLETLERELLSAFQSDRDICAEHLAPLPYLNACINEVLRLAPPFSAGILQRISKGATVDGTYIPAGVGITLSFPFPFHVFSCTANSNFLDWGGGGPVQPRSQ